MVLSQKQAERAQQDGADTQAMADQRVNPRQRAPWIRRAFLACAVIFALCVATQVFFAGLAVFVTPAHWARHISFVHVFEFVPLVMLILSAIGRLPVRLRWLSAGMFFLVYAQYFTANIRGQLPYISALHPVVALLIFWVSLRVVQEAWKHRFEAHSAIA